MCIYTTTTLYVVQQPPNYPSADEHTNKLVSRQLWGHLVAPLYIVNSLPSHPPPNTSIHPRHKYRKGILGTADRSLRWPQGTHAFLCGHTHGPGYPGVVQGFWLGVDQRGIILAEPSAKPFKRVQRPPVQERTAVLKDTGHQAPTPARKWVPLEQPTSTGSSHAAALPVPTEDPASQRSDCGPYRPWDDECVS